MASKRIQIKTAREIETMRRAGAILNRALDRVVRQVGPGVTTKELDTIAREELARHGGKPAFLGMYGFPAALCVSINEEVVHGIPGRRVLKEGDLVSLDLGYLKDGLFVDMARSVGVGRIDEASQRLIEAAEDALEAGIEQLRTGRRLGDVSAAVQRTAEGCGFSVVRDYTGHGIGRDLHEEPKIPNYGVAGRGVRWQAGMVVCIEPMINAGQSATRVLEDDWTVATDDGRRSAHAEHTIAITRHGPEILTRRVD